MANWYMKGQSNYDNSTGFHMGFYVDMNGYDESSYDSQSMPIHAESGDPFMAFGAKTSPWLLGQQQVEIGLWNHNRMRFDVSGVWLYHNASGVWLNAYSGDGGGASQLSDLSDVGVVAYTDGYVLRADGDSYEAGQLQWGDLGGSQPSPVSHASSHQTGGSDEVYFSQLEQSSGDSTLHNSYTTTPHVSSSEKTTWNGKISSLAEDSSPELAEDLDFNGYDGDVAGTIYHNDATRWLVRVTSDGTEGGTLYDIGLYWDTTPNTLEVVGYTNLNLGINSDHDIADITSAGLRLGAAGARVTTIATTISDTDTQLGTMGAVVDYVPTVSINNVSEDTTPTLGGNLDLDDHGLLMDATPASNGDYSGLVLEIDTTGCSTYNVIYCDAANSVLPADANGTSTYPAIGMVVAGILTIIYMITGKFFKIAVLITLWTILNILLTNNLEKDKG